MCAIEVCDCQNNAIGAWILNLERFHEIFLNHDIFQYCDVNVL